MSEPDDPEHEPEEATAEEVIGECSEVADEQLDEIEKSDANLYSDILTMCDLIFLEPGRAHSMSTAIRTSEGIRLRLAVPDHRPSKIFWSTSGPRIEAVFPYP